MGVALLAQNKTNGVARKCELGVALLAQSETSVAISSETRGVAADVEDPGFGKVGVAKWEWHCSTKTGPMVWQVKVS